jgi:hypothetical protein
VICSQIDSQTPIRATLTRAAKRRRPNYDEGPVEHPSDGGVLVQPPAVIGERTTKEGKEVDGVGTEEEYSATDFVQPIVLIEIPTDLQKLMLVVCPLLQGRQAVYGARFFKEVVGLCDHGTVVEARALLRETPVTESQVLQVWPQHPTNRNRYPLVLCTKSWQRLAFMDHHAKVYRGRPDNKYFSMTFLLAYYATFVYKCDVNWAKAAAD